MAVHFGKPPRDEGGLHPRAYTGCSVRCLQALALSYERL